MQPRQLFVTNGPAALYDDYGSVELTPRQETFARLYAELGNPQAAYRQAYDVPLKTLPGTVSASASRLASKPAVKARIKEVQQQLVLETIMTVRDAFAYQIDIATANPNDIAYIAKRCCRHCHGTNHAYQWKDANEWIEACAVALDNSKPAPSDEGGYGYSRAFDPVVSCPECLGNGVAEYVVNDTRNLTGKALRLLKGFDYKQGHLVVTLHDQAKAWEMALRMLGAFNDVLKLVPADTAAGKMPENINEKDAARFYLKLVGT